MVKMPMDLNMLPWLTFGHHLNIFSTNSEDVVKYDPPISALLQLSMSIGDTTEA